MVPSKVAGALAKGRASDGFPNFQASAAGERVTD